MAERGHSFPIVTCEPVWCSELSVRLGFTRAEFEPLLGHENSLVDGSEPLHEYLIYFKNPSRVTENLLVSNCTIPPPLHILPQNYTCCAQLHARKTMMSQEQPVSK